MKVMNANEACASVSYLFTEHAGVYPITPATPMSEKIKELSLKKEKNIFNKEVEITNMQSETGSIALCHGLINSGTYSSTYTSSQGLLLMIPEMYKIAGEMLPMVINVATRTISTHALSILGDHSDIYAAKNTGFAFLSSSSVQDTVYMTLISYLSSYKTFIPFVNFFDGFRTSHELNKINTISVKDIMDLLPVKEIKKFKDSSILINKTITGTNQNEDIYFENMEARNTDYNNLADEVNNYMNLVNVRFNTDIKPFNFYGDKSATKVIVAMGSICEEIKELVDLLNENGEKVGVITVHLFRPFSSKYLVDALPKSVKKIAVLDRAKEITDVGETLYLDVLSALNKENKKIKVIGGRYGISSKNVTLSDLNAVFKNLDNDMIDSFTIGIDDDVTKKSLRPVKISSKKKNIEMIIYGYGSDGMVGASKNLLKILGEEKGAFVQGYNRYDSRKSSGTTISYLRIGKEAINMPYYVEKPHFVVCSNDNYMSRYNMLYNIRKNGVFILNTDKDESILSNNEKIIISNNNIKVYFIDANKIAKEYLGNNKVSNIMLYTILYISKLLSENEIDKYLEDIIKETYKEKGEEVIDKNIASLKEIKENIISIENNKKWSKLKEKIKEEKTLLDKINSLDKVKVSDLLDYKNGKFKPFTSNNNISINNKIFPFWKSENCIECNKCALVCPHGAIVPKILTKDEALKNGDITYIPLMGKEEYYFALEINYDKCTSCGLCENVCMGKRGIKALELSDKKNKNNKINAVNKEFFDKDTIKGLGFVEPLFKYPSACPGCGETSYLKILSQIYEDSLVISNATGCSSIYGGSIENNPYNISFTSSLFEDNAEYGLGISKSINRVKKSIKEIMLNNIDNVSSKNKSLFNKYLENEDNFKITKEVSEEIDYEDIKELKKYKKYIANKTLWIVGGDGWAYDIDYSGIDHLFASKENVNILVLDTEVYSNTGAQESKSSNLGTYSKLMGIKDKNKKDLARLLINYEDVYVAQISLGANINQTIKALKEAASFNGPSIVIAYSPCINHGIKTNTIEEEKLVVQSGYFPLFRYINGKMNIDYKEPNFDLYKELVKNEKRYRYITDENIEKNIEYNIKKFEYYKSLEKTNK